MNHSLVPKQVTRQSEAAGYVQGVTIRERDSLTGKAGAQNAAYDAIRPGDKDISVQRPARTAFVPCPQSRTSSAL